MVARAGPSVQGAVDRESEHLGRTEATGSEGIRKPLHDRVGFPGRYDDLNLQLGTQLHLGGAR